MVEALPCTPDVWRRVERDWNDLASAAGAPVLLGRDWVGAWLDVYGRALAPEVVCVRSGRDLVGACLLVERSVRQGPFRVRRLHLNTAGEDDGDGVCLEYNRILCRPGCEDVVADALAEHLAELRPDELVACGVEGGALAPLRRALRGCRESVVWSSDCYVDLAALRARGVGWEAGALSRNARAQLRRSRREYAAAGPLRLEAAHDERSALEMLDELISLHRIAWQRRGAPGAFGPRAASFHRAFVARGIARGVIQLLRVRAGSDCIGLLYNVVERGRVYFYQSGLRYGIAPRERPGVVAHALAIEHCLAAGLASYHFLGGEASAPRYKRSLSSHSIPLAWATWRWPRWKVHAIDSARWLRALPGRLATDARTRLPRAEDRPARAEAEAGLTRGRA